MTPKNIALLCIAIALGVGLIFFLFGADSAPAPIVDEACPTGYTLVGEGCVTLQEACELQGDNYFYDISEEKCLPR
jgi:hypothetical protein